MDSRFFLAQTLDERLFLLRAAQAQIAPDQELGQSRIDRFKSSPAFQNPLLFQEYLAIFSADESELQSVLAMNGEDIAGLCNTIPSWISILIDTLSLENSSPVDESESRNRNPQSPEIVLPRSEANPQSTKANQQNIKANLRAAKAQSNDEFLVLLEPFVSKYKKKLMAAMFFLQDARNVPHFDIDLIAGELLNSLLLRLRRLIQKTLILETNIARLQERLKGETPEERYQSYIALLRNNDERLSIFSEYPVLARKCLLYFEQWYNSSFELLERFHTDYGLLCSFFSLKDPKLIKLRGAAGDAHKQGRSVHILEFEDGTKIVYKPRSLQLDQHFQDLIDDLNKKGLEPKLQTLRILPRENYGWTEFVLHEECKTKDEIGRFYQRQGSLLALLYATASTDLHLENLVACGENPVVVDLETVFHPEFSNNALSAAENAEDLARAKYLDSVLAVGLLPTPVHGSGVSMDKSALGAVANQTLPFEVDGFENFGTDRIRVAKVPGRIGEIHSRPKLNSTEVNLCDYRQDIENGFTHTYRLLLNLKDVLLAPNGPLARFRSVPVRAVIRPSAFYAGLLSEALHPTFNRNAMDQDLVFKELYRAAEQNINYLKTISCERKQLLSGDIPYFLSSPESIQLRTADGIVIDDVLACSGFDVCKRRIQRMCEEDLSWQLWLIDASLATLSIRNNRVLARKGYPPVFAYQKKGHGDYLDAAIACGNRLLETAVRQENQATWVSLNYVGGRDVGTEDHHYQIGTLNHDLYRGTLGIALFLAYLHKYSGKQDFKDLAEETRKLSTARLAELKSNNSPGAYIGLASHIYVHNHLASLWDRQDLFDLAVSELPDLKTFIDADKRLDIMAGSAGAIPVLLAIAGDQQESSTEALKLAKFCGDRLISMSIKENGKRFWNELSMPRGFSHGTAGIAWALSELASCTGDGKYLDAALEALEHERELLAGNNWTDIPDSPEGVAWCHGAAGIAMARLRMFQKHKSKELFQDAKNALQTVVQSPMREDHILCHGSLGNLEAILVAITAMPILEEEEKSNAIVDYALLQTLQRWTSEIYADVHSNGWRSNLPPQVMEPGLLTGLAGIGYGFLRSQFHAELPSVLLLEPPPLRSPTSAKS